jgi:hypothetical protein
MCILPLYLCEGDSMINLRQKIRSGWAWLSHASTAITFIQIFGWWPWILGACTTAAAVTSGLLERVPATMLVVAGIAIFASMLSLALAIQHAREKHATRTFGPAYEAWSHIDEFMTFQAACLWTGKEPKTPVPKGETYAVFTMIKEALRTGLIERSTPDNPIDQFIRVKRSELCKLAEAKRMRPHFLFPST